MAKGKFRVGKWVNLIGKILGSVVIATPAIESLAQAGEQQQLGKVGHSILYVYTGINDGQISTGPGTGGAPGWNGQQAMVGIGSVVGGLLLMKIFSYVAKHIG